MDPKDRLTEYALKASRTRLSRLHVALFGSCPLIGRRMEVETARTDLLRSIPRLLMLDERYVAALIDCAEGRVEIDPDADLALAA